MEFIRSEPPEFYGSHDVILGAHCLRKIDDLKSVLSTQSTELILVSDFDYTLSSFSCNLQCHDMIGYNKRYTKEFTAAFNEILKNPMESFADWWRVAHDLVVEKSGLTLAIFKERLEEHKILLRSGVPQLISMLKAKKVPLVILSAGITNVVTHTLRTNGVDVSHDELFQIDANYMEFDTNEPHKLIHIGPEPPVHSHSKKYMCLRVPHMFPNAANPDQVEVHIDPHMLPDVSSSASVSLSTAAETGNTILSAAEGDVSRRVSEVLDRINTGNADAGVDYGSNDDNSSNSNSFKPVADLDSVIAGVSKGMRKSKVALVLGDRETDFEVLYCCPEAKLQLHIGFARNEADAQALVDGPGQCDVVLVGEDHGVEPVIRLVQHLLQDK